MQFLLPLRVGGVTLADLDLRVYRGSAQLDGAAAAATLEDLGTGDYLLSGLPDGEAGSWYTLTAWHGAGLIHRTWPTANATRTPPGLILPARLPGLSLATLSVVIYRDFAIAGGVELSAVPAGDAGDYWLTGWPAAGAGETWAITADLGASGEFGRSWAGPVVHAATAPTAEQVEVRDDIEEDGAPVTLRWNRNVVSPAGGALGADPELVHDIETHAIVDNVTREIPSLTRGTPLAQVGDLTLMIPAVDLALGDQLVAPGAGWTAYLGRASHPDPDAEGSQPHPVLQVLETQYEGPDPLYYVVAARRPA